MSAGRYWLVAVLGVLTGAATMPLPAAAQEMAQPEVENAKYQFSGEVIGNDVYVRSGPGEGYYPTMKLDKGAKVTVVGIKFGWLKVLPPEGSFSYIPKAWVERSGDGSVGRVTKPDLIVRAGSALNDMKNAVQTSLNENDRVVILGEKDEYFRIQPPAGAYLYVFKDFVKPIQQVQVADAGTANTPAATDAATAAPDGATQGSAGTPDAAPPTADGTPSTQPSAPSTTQPTDAVAAAEAEFVRLEAQYNQVSTHPIDQQPVEEMLAGYEPLATGNLLPESMRRIAAYRVAILRERAKAKTELLALKAEQEAFEKRQQAATAERQELKDRIAASDVKIYAAVGELRPSSLQQGKELIFRLTDPANGRTVVYVRSNDPAYGNLIGKFVGVKGNLSTDAALNIQVIAPTAIEEVDPAQVNGKVAAQIVPPSMAAGPSGAP